MPHVDDKPERSLGLSAAQIAGSALSAVSAAFVASWAGTTGTLIGAAVGSVVATIGAATYTYSLRRGSVVVRRTAAQVRQTTLLNVAQPQRVSDGPLRTTADHEGPEEPPMTRTDAGQGGGRGAGDVQADDVGTDDVQADVTAGGVQAEREAETQSKRPPWGKVLLASLAVTVAVLGGITLVEAITGSPISSWLGNNSSQGTSVGHLVGSDTSSKDTGTNNTDNSKNDTTTPSEAPNPQDPATPEPSAQPSQVPSQAPSEPANPDSSTAP